MEKLILNTEKALLLDEKTLEEGNIKYHVSTSTIKVNGERVLEQMTVDAFIDGEWEHELSCVYENGDVIEAQYDEWLKLI